MKNTSSANVRHALRTELATELCWRHPGLGEPARRLELLPDYLWELARDLNAPSVEVAGIIVRRLRLKPELGAGPLAAAVTYAPHSSPSRMR